ncbi:bacteriohemerythrin [Paramagnetospirillum magneticum]|nr:bacteriohemerythrin [Paramagnetospirillum magneticum]
MFANLKIGTRLFAGFALVLSLTAFLGVNADIAGDALSEQTNKLYRHPFTVTNALQAANTHIVAMHRSMKDVALAKTPEELDRAVADVDAREKKVYEKFALARERFLGDKADMEAAAKAFADWKPIRDEVITAFREGRRDDAATITKTKGAAQVAKISETLEKVIAWAMDKAEAFMANAEQVNDRADLISRSGLAAALILGALVAWLITRSISRPINAMTGVMNELSGNNLSVDVPYADRGDEIGAMAKSVGHFKNQLMRVHQLEAEQEEQKKRAEADRMTAMRKMADTFEESVGKVIETVTSAATELQAASSQMSGTATETSAQATTVATSAHQASANVQTVASATEELAASIREIAHQVERSQAVSAHAGQEVNTTTSQVRALSESVSKIGEIVNLINDIAAQTNLLALNATIEAARAGDAGKGFAVVANEVKHLANQTARATSEIAGQIQAVQDGTNAAVHAIDAISSVIGEMGEISSAVAAAVEQQSGATTEIARNVEQAATGTEEVSSNITSVEQAARETGAAAEQIKDSSADLSRQAEFLRHEVGQFLAQVRADKKDMKLLVWDGALNTGVASVDRHHQAMYDQVNEFYRQMMSGDGSRAAAAMLAELNRSIQDHFTEEEALMDKTRYPAAEDHRRNHQAFLDRLAGMKTGLETNRAEAPAEMFEYVSTWLRGHIGNDDRALGLHLRETRAVA